MKPRSPPPGYWGVGKSEERLKYFSTFPLIFAIFYIGFLSLSSVVVINLGFRVHGDWERRALGSHPGHPRGQFYFVDMGGFSVQ